LVSSLIFLVALSIMALKSTPRFQEAAAGPAAAGSAALACAFAAASAFSCAEVCKNHCCRARDAPACTLAGAKDSVCWALIGLLESVKQACNCSCNSTVRVSQKEPHLWYSAYLPVRRILHGCFCSGQQSTGTSLDVVFVCDDRTHQPHSNTTLWVLVHPMHCYGYGRQNDVHISVHTWIVKISLTGQGRQCYIILPSEDDIEHPLIVRSVFCKPRRHAPLNDSPAKWKCCSS